jgi:hypothetical protein
MQNLPSGGGGGGSNALRVHDSPRASVSSSLSRAVRQLAYGRPATDSIK